MTAPRERTAQVKDRCPNCGGYWHGECAYPQPRTDDRCPQCGTVHPAWESARADNERQASRIADAEILHQTIHGTCPVCFPPEQPAVAPAWRTVAGRVIDRAPDRIDRHSCGCVTGWDDAHEQCVLVRCEVHNA